MFTFKKTARPERVIQFGEGGFLRGFVDWMLQKLNDNTDFCGNAVVVQPIAKGMCEQLEAQDCVYTHLIRGTQGVEKSVIDVISRCVRPYDDYNAYLALADNPDFRFIVSNTTEAGICFDASDRLDDAPPKAFPAKLTQLLYRRYQKGLGGFVLLPCELIDRNGDNLKKIVLQYAALWGLESDFSGWIEQENHFCNTLVDRINTGFPRDEQLELGYEDPMLNTSEYFHLWVIETDHDVEAELPFTKAGLNVIVTRDKLERYRTRKVRILNGAHTSLVAHAMLSGFDTVKSCMDDANMRAFAETCIFEEIIPTLDLPREELVDYANSVLERFSNPYIHHFWSSIVLNSVSKFKVRVLPSILEYVKRFDKTPQNLLFSLGRLIALYRTDLTNDSPEVTEFMRTHSVREILANTALWDTDLTPFADEVEQYAHS